MPSQLDLLSQPAARRSDPDTSHEAARRCTPGSHYARILHALDFLGREGGTHRELARETGLEPVQVDRRLHELRKRGVVVRLAQTRGAPAAHVHVRRDHLEGAA